MCGICGAFALDGVLQPEARYSVLAMCDALSHRGPDGEGFVEDERAAFGHRRLAIIDREGGHQPMANENGSRWVVFNGEIYNHRALRSVLAAKGHRFRTASDTEVILHAYEEYGTSCVERLEGMFAFAIYDAPRQELFVARDRLGKKPLFYTVVDGVLHFASELPALTRMRNWRAEIDLTALESYLSLGYFLAPSTIYRNVFKLEPGHWLRATRDGLLLRKYWDITEFDTDHRPTEQLLTSIDETLRTAVRDRLESEVPLGAFLSGGIDSSLVVSYMAEAAQEPPVTIYAGFAGRSASERQVAGMTASYFGTSHYAEVLDPHLSEVMGPIVAGLGEPLADDSAVPMWYLARAARRHVTVALSGDGGDEGFAGYDFRYVPHAFEASVREWLPAATMPAVGWLGRHWSRHRLLPRPLRLATVFENLSRDPAAAYYADLTFLKPAETRRLLGAAPDPDPTTSPVYAGVTEPYRQCPSDSAVQRAGYADLKIYLPNAPLVKVDRMSMAHALEVRCPFLDRRLVELAFRIPARRKQRGRNGKLLLRSLARRRLPGRVWQLPKQGFTAPVGDWLAGAASSMFREEVLRSNAAVSSYIDVTDLGRRFERHKTHVHDHSYELWAAWVLERWLTAHQRPVDDERHVKTVGRPRSGERADN